ncbi:MAG: YdcF family protein [Clostridia bacterium]|nr:YdcF family protein [Clostridia bacterium]
MRIEFDSRDKKPKLLFLIPVVLAAAAAAGLLHIGGAENNIVPLFILTIALLAVVVASLIWAFVEQLRYNPYSYNTIYYIGFALFLSSVLLTCVVVLVRVIRFPGVYTVNEIPHILVNSAKNYMLFSIPFILVFSVLLFVSNISLLMHERKRFVNALGIILSLMLVAGELFLYFYDRYASGSRTEVMRHDLFANVFAAFYLYFECMLIGSIIANIIVVRYKAPLDRDYLIVLGCGLRKDGTPTPLLKSRIDRAIAFYKQQKAETGKELIFITSGGKGDVEANSESLAMTRYLIEQGIPKSSIVMEDRSRDTIQNMRFSKEKIAERSERGKFSNETKVAYATSNYHVFRSGICARRVKIRAIGVGAATKWYFWPNAAVREFVGLIAEHRLKQAVILTCILVTYIALTIAVYS